jgi:hypothetical protein
MHSFANIIADKTSKTNTVKIFERFVIHVQLQKRSHWRKSRHLASDVHPIGSVQNLQKKIMKVRNTITINQIGFLFD